MHTTDAPAAACPNCGYRNPAGAGNCGLCGELLVGRRAAATAGPAIPPTARPAPPTIEFDAAPDPEPTIAGLPRRWFFLALGVPCALLFASGPFMQRYAWFLAALFHEVGHAFAGLFCGMPSIPAISLRGHAATMHGEQVVPLAIAIWLGLGGLTWRARHDPIPRALLGSATLVYPLVAFTGARQALFLTAGHLGELAFATFCLFRAHAGATFRDGDLERSAYSAVGWLLVGSNAGLCLRLATSAIARDDYAHNGSFGLQNDYIRLADDVLGWRLESVALLMLAAALLPVPIVLLAGRWARLRPADA